MHSESWARSRSNAVAVHHLSDTCYVRSLIVHDAWLLNNPPTNNSNPCWGIHDLRDDVDPVATGTVDTAGGDDRAFGTSVSGSTDCIGGYRSMRRPGRLWRQLAVEDPFGNPVTGFTFSGFNAGLDFTESQVPTAVPLPASAWLLGTGIAGLLWRRRAMHA